MINSVCGIGSTGKICCNIAEKLEEDGNVVRIAYGRNGFVPKEYQHFAVRIGTDMHVKIHAMATRVFDSTGFHSRSSTRKFLKWADEFKPDLIWIHNLHGYYINIEMLFEWIKSKPNIEVKWTLHDCWAFTGHCAHYMTIQCDKWKRKVNEKGCQNCQLKKEYPASLFLDRSAKNYKRKKQAFCGVNNLQIIVPSKWLGEQIKKSFLQEYTIEIARNTVDTNIFKPTKCDNSLVERVDDKKILLGVAYDWSWKKGLDDFIKVADYFEKKNKNYVIVLVGASKEKMNLIAKKQGLLKNVKIKQLPANMFFIDRTNSREELAGLYTRADVFLNLTHEDNFPTVNLEAEACGTPVFTYNTGGCAETVSMERSKVIEPSTFERVIQELLDIDINHKKGEKE